MKEKVSLIIKILGIDVRELVIDLSTDFGIFNSIEWYEKDDKIYLYSFEDDFEICYDFDELNNYEQKQIYLILAPLIWN